MRQEAETRCGDVRGGMESGCPPPPSEGSPWSGMTSSGQTFPGAAAEGWTSTEDTAGPSVHMVVLLLEAGQRRLIKVEEAIQLKDPQCRDYHLRKFLCTLQELDKRLNHEQGGSLVANLTRVYGWWGGEAAEASDREDLPRLKRIHGQMGDIRRSWEHVLFGGVCLSENPEF